MKPRSTVFLSNKILSFLKILGFWVGMFMAAVFVFNIFFGLFKQIVAQKRLNSRLESKKQELSKLEKENLILKQKLQEVEDPDFLNYEAARLFGLSKDGNQQFSAENIKPAVEKEGIFQVMTPNWKKWLELFGF